MPVIFDLSFEVRQGEVVAIVGSTAPVSQHCLRPYPVSGPSAGEIYSATSVLTTYPRTDR